MSTTTTTAPSNGRSTSEVPYLPGLDGMRALAVVAVMVYHADPAWLPGGFLGVEVFFVISGYLITLLLIGEHERTGRVALGPFWIRRARRLLPALGLLLLGVSVYTAVARRDALGQLRGDVLAAGGYASNWYQVWVGQGYTSSGDFAPLRHLWSLAVEEQFYVLWPLVMVVLLRVGRRRLPAVSWALLGTAVAISAVVAVLHRSGPISTPAETPGAYWSIGGRSISKVDVVYLSSPTRAIGLLLGSAFAMVWRPAALLRGPMRRRGPMLDAVAVVGLVALGALCWYLHIVTTAGADPWLFRGGFLLTGLATLCVIAAVTHRGSATGRLLGAPALVWVGTRSYGLYLFHWPIYQGIRRVAGNVLTVTEFVAAMLATAAVAELSYRYVERPIRRGALRRTWRSLQLTGTDTARRALALTTAAVTAFVAFAGASLATAELKANEIAVGQQEGAVFAGDPFATTTTTARDRARTTTAAASTTSSATTSSVASSATTSSGASTVPPTTAPGASPVLTPVTTPAPAIVTETQATPAPAPATSLPPAPPADPCVATPIPRYALGDSVMLGAAGELAGAGFCVDAVTSRAFVNGLQQVIDLRAAGRLGPVVVVALGTNGPISDGQLTRMMDELTAVPVVAMVTTKADRSYVPGNNDKLRALPAAYPNVHVVDWATIAPSCPGGCFSDDGIHLTPPGRGFYAQQITTVTG